ncbi:3326_t:CDS:2, partial [Entrophospora sp. SA101]
MERVEINWIQELLDEIPSRKKYCRSGRTTFVSEQERHLSSKDKTKVPTDDDLFHMQTQVVVSHFCGNHENFWPDF